MNNIGFILLDKNYNPKVALYIENEMQWGMKKYNKLYPDQPLPHITPHVFRHIFCMNMANAGMDIKTLQYLMEHSDEGVTLDVYTHLEAGDVKEEFIRIANNSNFNVYPLDRTPAIVSPVSDEEEEPDVNPYEIADDDD